MKNGGDGTSEALFWRFEMKPKILITFGILLSLVFLNIALISALMIGSVTTTPNEIAPGEVSIIELSLENNAEEDIKDVSVSLIFRELVKDSFDNIVSINEIPFAPYNSASEYNIDEIKDGKTKYAKFKIKALNDADSGIYKIPIEISYEAGGIVKTKNSLISLTVNSEPIISASLEEGLFLKGQENEVIIKIVNKGLSDARFLEAEIKKGTYYTILSPQKIYIGDLDSDDFDSANFRVYFKPNVPGTVRLPVKVTYKDVLNKKYTEDLNLQLRAYSREEAVQLGLLKRNNTVIYVVVVVVLIILYIIYRKLKKKLREKKEK